MATVSLALPIIGLIHDETNPPGLIWENNVPALLFDDTTVEPVYASFRLPDDYASAPVLRVQFSAMSAIVGTMGIQCAVMAVSSGEAADVISYDTVNTATAVTVPGTAGFLTEIALSLANNDTLAASDLIYLKINRTAADTATGDMEVRSVTFEYTA